MFSIRIPELTSNVNTRLSKFLSPLTHSKFQDIHGDLMFCTDLDISNVSDFYKLVTGKMDASVVPDL